ncbi:LisH domain-containing protein [Micromonospora saelicesensis]|uniref:LisH domain-containing protein n=2 Tax=Micromonospora saelicesensis TaxID=285676 RepID=A0ABX9CCG7_9ACTN|nr:LisH domain-containing protein [Micromonospora saelicesensis]
MYQVRNVPDMAFRTWGRLLLTALGVSVLAGAGQLGVAYGFGIVRLTGAFTGTTVNQWPAQLVWVGWFAANAAVAGAVLTGRLARRDAPAASTGRQLAVAGAAALGATVIAPLCMQPARAAELISVDPVWAVGICAMVGAVIGAGAAIAVLFRPELGWNMAAVAGAVWLLALISVLPSLGTAGPLPTVRLGVLEPSWLDDAAAQRLALLLLPIVALLAGAATAGLARWRGQAPLVSGATGVAGPVLVAFAYLTAGPGDAVDRYQTAPYYGSLIAILAGALGAAAAALLRWPTGTRTADPQAIEPTAILRPLPAGPALPGAANDRDGAANDRDGAERTDTETTNAELATVTKPAGVVAGPWATGDPDAVRTVPAHWDWPDTTASGQHGPAPATAAPAPTPAVPTPAAPTQPAAWVTAPTGEFTAPGQTPQRHDDVLATTEPSAGTDASNVTDATGTGTTAGRADATTPTGGRAVDEPTGSTATDTSGSTATSGRPTGGRTTRKSAATPSGTGAPGSGTTAATSAPTTSDAPTPATGGTVRTSAAPTSTGSGTEATSTAPTGTDAPSPAATASTGTGSGTSTEASSAGTADHGAPETPLTIKPRRGRKSKANPDTTASDAADDTSPAGSATTNETTTRETTTDATATRETTTGRATKGNRPSRSADSTASDAATDTPAPSRGSLGKRSSSTSEVASAATSGTAAARTTAPGATRAPATPATGSKQAPAASTTAETSVTQGPANPEPSTTPTDDAQTPATATDATQTPATGTGATPASTTATGATRAAAAPTTAPGQVGADAISRVAKAGTGSKAAPADATSDSAIAGARGTDSAQPAAEDVPTAGLFGPPAASDQDTDRWTPAPSAWPVTATWTVPPQASEPEATASEGSSRPDEPTGPTPRPRHRAPLPDLSRAGTWNAFDTSRRPGSAGSQDSSTARTAPTEAGETTGPAEHPGRPEFPGTVGAPSGAAATSATAADSATGTGIGDVAATDATSATPTQPKVAEQPSRRGRLGGLFRRNRSRADEESPKTSDEAEPLASQDEEFVDWVAGLSKPVSDNEPEQENGRRSLRSTGRHHRD